jgi:formate hydrogenlyase transcriptional activator
MSGETESMGEAACGERLVFESLLANLSARFINLPPDQVDSEIGEAQRQICEMLDIDMSALWQLSGEPVPVLVLTHPYINQAETELDGEFSHDDFPWVRDELLAGRVVKLNTLDELPEAAALDHESARRTGIKSSLSFPLSAGGNPVFGVLVFNTLQSQRNWPEGLVSRLQVLAQIFANAIARKQADHALRKSEAQLELAASSANAGLWSLDLATEHYWLTAVSRKMFGFGADETVTLKRVLDGIHPEDRDRVRQTISAVVQSGEEGGVEYRISGGDGRERWMVSRGRIQHGNAGSPGLLMGVTLDITEKKAQEESLSASAARLSSAIELAELGFYEVVDGNHFIFLDNLGRELAGIPEGENRYDRIFQLWAEHLHPEDRPCVLDTQRRQREGEKDKVTVEYRYQHPQRGMIWIHHLSHILNRKASGDAVQTIGVMREITTQKNYEENLRKALEQVQQLRDRLQMENTYLREQLRRDDGQDAIIGESDPVLRMLAKAKQVAPTDSSVLITGETGTGKELLAQAIHDLSPRKARPMVKVNCAALPAPLIEGELFGREKGAYTGAMTQQHGRFEVADGSTIFLDEIGDLPLELQAKLLRVLQDGRFERLGSTRTISVDVRVIAATNHELAAMVRDGKFREDLFHRLNVFPIEAPPLRARTSDIPILAWKFVQEFNVKMGRSVDSISKQTMEWLIAHPWPGNIRELRNMVERAMITSNGHLLNVEFPKAGPNLHQPLDTLEDVERSHILSVLEHTHWRISGKGGAAEVLGLVPTTLHSRMKKLGIFRPHP